ncbi:MAG: hypothetical protein LBU32_17280 [Clostridiales bacterium]|jgi:hypothetical protein|nr:hypothetical protein [Clostridiales bacterium]
MLSVELELAVFELAGRHPKTMTKAKKELDVHTYQSGRQWLSVPRSEHKKSASLAELVNTRICGYVECQATKISQS